MHRINEIMIWFIEKISKVEKPTSKLTERYRGNPNEQNQEQNKGHNNRHPRNLEMYKGLVSKAVFQQNGKSEGNEQFS